jgi:hypothetical protein
MQTQEKERVRKNTSEKQNREIDKKTQMNIAFYSNQPSEVQSKHLEKLEKEWDIERVLELNASLLSLAGVLLSTRKKWWLLLPGFVTSFLAQHALQGWCPPLPLLRKLGFRTRAEIDQERFTLKTLRENAGGTKNLRKAWAGIRNDRTQHGLQLQGATRRKQRSHY